MKNPRHYLSLFAFAILALPVTSYTQSGPVNVSLFSDMRWREIGPMRAGRTRALAGVASEPATFYLGAVGGGVFKTTDAGATWHSVWDKEPTGSIGSIAVAESDPKIVYVASGEGLARPDLSTGDGVYKSTDGGETWEHLGLREGQQIGEIAVDPTNADRVFVAVTGHPYGPNNERGLYRSTDGGKNFKRVLFVNDETGASEVAIDPKNPNIVFAGMWQRREGPWENGAWSGADGGLFRSDNGGDTWTKLTGHGLPENIVQVNITISPTDSQRIYTAIASQDGKVGLYRSDDGGANWIHAAANDSRPEERIGGGDLPVPRVDPKDPDTVYVASIVTWKSTDKGVTWTGLRGSPGGDDYQNVYINPNNTKIIALASDQGAIITQNGGESWTQWYNQPTAQVYHVTADNAFPYRVCGGQQDSGSACVSSRSNDGRITFHDWHPAGIEEYGYAAPDPLDPDIVYGGKVTRYDRRTGQVENIEPSPLRSYRVLRTEPLMFSPVDPHRLYFATNTLWLTTDYGKNWKEISPDLSRESYELPPTLDFYKDSPTAKPIRRGVIYSLALSPLDINRLWAGTDDGLIWTTTDGGGHWQNVTPPELKPFWKVFNMDPGHFDKLTAYAAINTMRLDDMRPHLFRTHDGGKTWQEINNGIPDGAATSTIREDPKRKGLLYAGTETQVYVSFDDGDHWQSLRLNMPASSVRDLQIKGDDLIVGTHGRGFLILDDVTPLRQISEAVEQKKAYLYKPQTALRIRNNMNPPTPWPPDMATGENPPDGAIVDYYLSPDFTGDVTLEILDSKGEVVSRFKSTDPVPQLDPRYPDPTIWARPPRVLYATPGHHRFLWDMQYPQVPGMSTEPDAETAVPHDTPPVSTAPWVMPGSYSIRLIASGETMTEPLKVVMDPRVKTSEADLAEQFKVSKSAYDQMLQATEALHQITVLREQLKARSTQAPIAGSGPSLEEKLEKIAGGERGERRMRGGAGRPANLNSVRMQLARLEHSIESADMAPTTAQIEAVEATSQPLPELLHQWEQIKQTDLKALNATLKQQHLAALRLDTSKLDHGVIDQVEMGDEE
ncbi:glycoside hydrolase [Acidicapsa dinghuensis]|uniref:Glycoside hydrolase n=1 Tax=Acidicapsa dinghuensis TaxID=2218256 RepID=A0ABW1EKN6_9BACT|nr:glycoside hydrolase [Acidicapsa dinghuensis]